MDWLKYCEPQHWHPAANLVPLIPTHELEPLGSNIEEHGLQEQIVLFQGKVLDGRNRLRACKLKGIKLTGADFINFQPNGFTPEDFVVMKNVHRRQLTLDQRAALAAALVPMFQADADKRAGGRPKKHQKPSAHVRGVKGKCSELAAKFVGGVGQRTVEKVLALEKKAAAKGKSGIIKKIRAGKLSLSQARNEVDKLYDPRPLHEQFGAPPFSVLDTRQGYWRQRKEFWKDQGADGGHNEQVNGGTFGASDLRDASSTSKFDPVLAELVYRWFCPPSGRVLDPFAGEAIKGIVAAKMGLDYTGLDIREKQLIENHQQAKNARVQPRWICADSMNLSHAIRKEKAFDLIFTSPPYDDLEIYSDNGNDVSTLKTHAEFMRCYEHIFRQAVKFLKSNRFLVVKVKVTRDRKTGFYRNFVGENVALFDRLGLHFYNDAVLINSNISDALRVRGQFPNYRKLVHSHQNILCFFNGDPNQIPKELGLLNGYEDY